MQILIKHVDIVSMASSISGRSLDTIDLSQCMIHTHAYINAFYIDTLIITE